MRCLVTGASGHLGSYLTHLLVRRGHAVVGLVRPESDLWRLTESLPSVQLIRGDLSRLDTVASELVACAPEVVFHLGWQGVTRERRNDPKQILANLTGSLQLVDLARQAGCQCWVGIGSQAEYGPYNGILREDVPTQPVTAYGLTKLCVGLLSALLCKLADMRHVWLRLLATYGPRDDVHHLIPSVILKLLAGETPALTEGAQRWDYLYVEDAAEAIYQTAMCPQASGIFNLGSGDALAVRSIVEHIRDLTNPGFPLRFGSLPDSPDHNINLQTDIAALQRATGWTPRVSLDDGLRATVAWYQRVATGESPLSGPL